MQPEQTPTSSPDNIAPPQAQPLNNEALGQPQAQQQPIQQSAQPQPQAVSDSGQLEQQQPSQTPQNPSPSPLPQAPTGIAIGDVEKNKKLSIWFAVGSYGVFVVGLIFGFAAVVGAFLGIIGVQRAKSANYKNGIILGLVGVALNSLSYLLALLMA